MEIWLYLVEVCCCIVDGFFNFKLNCCDEVIVELCLLQVDSEVDSSYNNMMFEWQSLNFSEQQQQYLKVWCNRNWIIV